MFLVFFILKFCRTFAFTIICLCHIFNVLYLTVAFNVIQCLHVSKFFEDVLDCMNIIEWHSFRCMQIELEIAGRDFIQCNGSMRSIASHLILTMPTPLRKIYRLAGWRSFQVRILVWFNKRRHFTASALSWDAWLMSVLIWNFYDGLLLFEICV